MSGRIIFQILGAITVLSLISVAPVAAQDLQFSSTNPNTVFSADEGYEYEPDVVSLTELTEGGKRRGKPNLRSMLRRVEREWPRLLLRYAQPAVRGLLADRQTGSNSLMLKTTFFRDNAKGLHLAGGLGRNTFGEREARLQFSARF